jgi:hypothetical protein
MWSVLDSHALWESKLLHAKIDLRRPELGLHSLVLNATPLQNLRLFQTQLEPSGGEPQATLSDVFQRGAELAVTYAETAEQPVQRQLHWKIAETIEPLRVVVDLVVCVETSQLDSDPRISVASSSSPGSWLQLRQVADQIQFEELGIKGEPKGCPVGVYMARCPNSSVHYAQLLLPSDDLTAKVSQTETDGTNTLKAVLFSERLEKGVIRCARIRGVICESVLDEANADELACQFRNTPMPLGTM